MKGKAEELTTQVKRVSRYVKLRNLMEMTLKEREMRVEEVNGPPSGVVAHVTCPSGRGARSARPFGS